VSAVSGEFVFKLPDLGEGTVEAEIIQWYVNVGDTIAEDQAMVEVMTDKASVEVPAPVGGTVLATTGTPGDKVAVGSPLVVIGLAGAVRAPAASVPDGTRVKTSPANRRRAREAGIELHRVVGTGPRGRILQGDIAAASARLGAAAPSSGTRATTSSAGMPLPATVAPPAAVATPSGEGSAPAAITEIKVIGLRRVIAERMSEAKRNIPHFAYVEEVDVTELEALRQHLNGKRGAGAVALTYLPVVIAALVRTLRLHPGCNCRYDASRGVLLRHTAVHVGIATQTADGLKVPVLHDAGGLTLWEIESRVRDLALRARSNHASRDELSGSTITVTSLGKLGGIASTPVINAPEVAIVGLNRAEERPVVRGGAITVRRIMNLSSSFDHRFVDGYDAAAMIQTLKDFLERPATIFIPEDSSA
jgi:2-oxoisovalerate dehydrogenase E2 component (dihydrolipoyl transacylase)